MENAIGSRYIADSQKWIHDADREMQQACELRERFCDRVFTHHDKLRSSAELRPAPIRSFQQRRGPFVWRGRLLKSLQVGFRVHVEQNANVRQPAL